MRPPDIAPRIQSVTDPRRRLWVLGYAAPAIAPFLLILHAAGVTETMLALTPLILLFGIAPLADHLIGRDRRNIALESRQVLEADPFYRHLLYGIVAAYVVGVVAAGALAVSATFTPLEWVAFAVGIGFIHSLIVLVSHELGHSVSPLDQRVAQIALMLMAYGHFGVEHNRNHHVKIATPDDPASSRFNESIYAFACREIPGTFLGALQVEGVRLRRKGVSWWNPGNRVLQNWAGTLVFAGFLVWAFGWPILGFYALHCATVWFSITMANYTAHYGLLRRRVRGRREPCRPGHSWSSCFLLSNLLFYNLQRHADHHMNARRPFQTLAHLENTPDLPAGIPGLFCMMLLPPVWFRVMNPRLLNYVGGDMTRINTGGDV